MKIKINQYSVLALSLVPFLILGGCASNDTFTLTDQSPSIVPEALNSIEVIDAKPDQEVIELSAETNQPIVTETIVDVVIDKSLTPKPVGNIIGFDFDKDNIDAKYGEVLWQHAQYLKENSNMVLNISGHTDSSGARLYNEFLSQKRADQVAKILVEFGAPEKQIKTIGNADDMPLAGAVYENQHRRVEFDYQDNQIVSNQF